MNELSRGAEEQQRDRRTKTQYIRTTTHTQVRARPADRGCAVRPGSLQGEREHGCCCRRHRRCFRRRRCAAVHLLTCCLRPMPSLARAWSLFGACFCQAARGRGRRRDHDVRRRRTRTRKVEGRKKTEKQLRSRANKHRKMAKTRRLPRLRHMFGRGPGRGPATGSIPARHRRRRSFLHRHGQGLACSACCRVRVLLGGLGLHWLVCCWWRRKHSLTA